MKNRLILLLPLGVFTIVGVFLVFGLGKDQSIHPAYLLNKPVPDLELVDLPNLGPAFTPEDLEGQVTLVNVFGSWCAACRIEHPTLLDIKERGDVPIFGINWADTPERGAGWLARWGNSYNRVGNDEAGRNVIRFGVTGAPETFVVDHHGHIRYRHVGPVTEDTWKKTLKPMVDELQMEADAVKG